MQGALTQEYQGSFEEVQHSRQRSGPQNYVPNFEDRTLVQRSINTDTFADGACEARSRQEEEVDAWPSSTTTNAEIVRNPRLPCGWRRDGPISLSLLLHYGQAWRSSSFRELDPSRSPQTYQYLSNAVLVLDLWALSLMPHPHYNAQRQDVWL